MNPITEKDVRDFISAEVDKLATEHPKRSIILWCIGSRYHDGYGSRVADWYAKIGHDDFSGETLDELMKNLADLPSANRAKAAALRKEADELEASIRVGVAT